jgi:hypothetical protein
MEDYEYLYLLGEYIRRIEGLSAAPGISSSRQEELIQEAVSARQVLENVLFCVTSDRVGGDRRMKVLLTARRQIARKIVRLSRRIEGSSD